VLFLVNPFAEPREARIELRGARPGAQAKVEQLSAGSPDAVNSFDAPEAVSPRTFTIDFSGSTVTDTLPPHSLTVMRIPITGTP
jgi:alpha-L-arabinofuranosidase